MLIYEINYLNESTSNDSKIHFSKCEVPLKEV